MADLAPAFHLETPEGDERERRVCDHCGWVDYRNPRIVVGSVATWTEPGAEEPRILMCRRAIEPRRGFWTLPAGFMETGETVRDAAAREAREEACCEIRIDALLAVYDVVHVQQVQVMFRASLDGPGVAAGPESLEARSPSRRWNGRSATGARAARGPPSLRTAPRPAACRGGPGRAEPAAPLPRRTGRARVRRP